MSSLNNPNQQSGLVMELVRAKLEEPEKDRER